MRIGRKEEEQWVIRGKEKEGRNGDGEQKGRSIGRKETKAVEGDEVGREGGGNGKECVWRTEWRGWGERREKQ